MTGDLILVVDDEDSIREIVSLYLENEGYEVVEAADGEEAVMKAKERGPSLIVLDLMLPVMDGWEVCREVRRFSEVPIIMLTARGDMVDRVVGLEIGADDYLAKPFSPRELVARVKAVLRRTHPVVQQTGLLSYGDVCLDKDSRRVRCKGTEVALTPKEFDLLAFMMSARGTVCSRDLLLQQVWGYDYFGDTRTVDSHIRSLREKLGQDSARSVRTVWGIGYKFEEPDNAVS